MTARPPKILTTPWLAISYIGILLAGYVLLNLLIWLVMKFFNTSFENNSMGLILVCVAAMTLGQYWFNSEQTRPSSSRAWTVAVLCTIVTAVLQIFAFWVIANMGGVPGLPSFSELRDEQATTLALIAAGVTLLTLLLIRVGLWFGFRQGAKLIAAKQSK